MHFHVISSFLVLTILFDVSRQFSDGAPAPVASAEDTERGIKFLMEYKEVLSPEQFDKVIAFYSNESQSILYRERQVVEYLSEVISDELRPKMPIPLGFRKYSPESQEKMKAIYYQRGLSFDEKVFRIGMIIQQLPSAEREQAKNEEDAKKTGVNDNPQSGLIEFEVNVTSHYNGYFKKEQLMAVMDDEDRTAVEKTLSETTPRHEKNHAIGELLRRIYQKNPAKNIDRWPGMFGTEHTLPKQTVRAITHLLFNSNPNGNPAPYVDMLRQMVDGNKENHQLQQEVQKGNGTMVTGEQQPEAEQRTTIAPPS